nr:F-box/kelch-repeat protein At3g23880-like [Ipomoea batatas]GMD57804.1 F-box/kelch-repeat protein At3g23880-like [Ipomoea batatas]
MADQGNNNSSTVLPDCSLPGDIMEEILLRLPVKVLLRFLSVSKSCYAFLKDFLWIAFFSIYLFCVLMLNAVFLSSQKYLCQCPNRDLFVPAMPWYALLQIVGPMSVYGILQLGTVDPDSSALSSTCMKLGYIHEINEHMLLKVPIGRGHGAEEGPKLVWVYTFSLNYWRCKETTIPPFEWRLMESSVTLTLNGVMHWFKNYDRDTIISFDLMNDVFNSIAVPVSHCFPDGDFFISRDLVVLEGSLSVIAHPEYNDYAPGGYEIWVMKEYGIEESWTKKYSIPPFSTFTRPLRIWKANKLAFNSYCGIVDDGDEPIPILSEVLSYDLVTKSIEYFELPRQLKGYSHYYTRDFVESL